jgi:hypothetical protein
MGAAFRVNRTGWEVRVPAFDRDAVDRHDVDFMLVQNSSVAQFWRKAILNKAVGWLRDHGYDVISLDASIWTADADLHRDIAKALSFPDYYGCNLAALHDCFSQIAHYDYASSESAAGFVLVLTGYDNFARHCPRTAWAVLDSFAIQARLAALIGHRMICLIQCNDPDFSFEPVGATPVDWNNAEWFKANRRPPRKPKNERPTRKQSRAAKR